MRYRLSTKRITYVAALTAMALILHLVENWIPPVLTFALGTKIGLANVVTLFAIVTLGWYEALIILVVRCLLGSLFGGNMFTGLMYSLGGGLAAFSVMTLCWYVLFPRLSLCALSILGACTHNLVQLLIASLFVGQIKILYLLPFNIAASFAAGVFIGLAVHFSVKYLPKRVLLYNF